MIGRVYRVSNADLTIQYIGSTQHKISRRWVGIKSAYKSYIAGRNTAFYSIFRAFDEHGIEPFAIHLIYEGEFETRQDLFIAEQEAIESHQCINMNRAYRSHQSLIEDNRVSSLAYIKRNRERLRVAARVRILCVCGKSYNYGSGCNHKKTKYHIDFINSQQV